MGLCIYSHPDAYANSGRYALMPSIQAARQWSWSNFCCIDRSPEVMAINYAPEKIFTSDAAIHSVARHTDHPL